MRKGKNKFVPMDNYSAKYRYIITIKIKIEANISEGFYESLFKN
jgi:hypothetical protein